jgi:hypothetical protein
VTERLKETVSLRGADTHGIRSFRREMAGPIVSVDLTGKDIFATELVLSNAA